MPTKVGWWNAPIAFWNLAKAIKHKKFNSNVFKALLGQGIDECLVMARLGYLGSLKSNESQAETTWKSKLYENENMVWEKSFRLNL